MYREICADLIWVELHLAFTKYFLDHLLSNNIKLHYIEKSEFNQIGKGFCDTFFKQFKSGIECNQKISWLGVNRFSASQVDFLYKVLHKGRLDIDLKNASYKF
jgi:hypothetical protein